LDEDPVGEEPALNPEGPMLPFAEPFEVKDVPPGLPLLGVGFVFALLLVMVTDPIELGPATACDEVPMLPLAELVVVKYAPAGGAAVELGLVLSRQLLSSVFPCVTVNGAWPKPKPRSSPPVRTTTVPSPMGTVQLKPVPSPFKCSSSKGPVGILNASPPGMIA
jgi:hypothetical protein